MRTASSAITPAALALVTGLTLTTATRAAAAGEEHIWLEVDRPYDGWVELGLSPLLPVRGAAGTVGRGLFDLVVILDVSRSTKDSSGVDVNRDGDTELDDGLLDWLGIRISDSRPRPDSILFAEVEAVRRLHKRLAPQHSRIGLVTLRETATLRSSLQNSAEELGSTLDQIEAEGSRGRTNMAQAIRVGLDALHFGARSAGPDRDVAMVLLSDGYPTAPGSESAALGDALDAAGAAADLGIRIHTIALGVREDESFSLREIARLTGGEHVPLRDPGEIIEALPNLDLRGLADVRVVNRTTGTRARSLRVWADGSFDAWIELREGKNRLSISARGPGGARTTTDRYVYFAKREPRSLDDQQRENRKLEELRELMHGRRVRIEVDREIERRRRDVGHGRTVEIETEH